MKFLNDASIDVLAFDPVPNKGDGGINDYLYEKGNQLTILVYAIQNISNNLKNDSKQLKIISKQLLRQSKRHILKQEP